MGRKVNAGDGEGAPRMAAEYTAAVAPTRPLVVARDCEKRPPPVVVSRMLGDVVGF